MLSDLRAMPRAFWVLFAGTFINRFGTFVWPFLTIYLTRQGHSLTAAALAVSTFGVGCSLGSVFGGWLSDHVGRRNTIVIGTTAAAGTLMMLYTASGFPAVLLWTFLTGFSNGTYVPGAQALLTDVVPETLRPRAFSALRMAANAGMACGVSTAGFMAQHSFFGLFVADAATTLCYSLLALLALPHGLRRQTSDAPWRAALARLRGDRKFHAQFIATFCAAFIFAQFGSVLSIHCVDARLTLKLLGKAVKPETVYGLLVAWNCLMVMTCELPLIGYTSRLNPYRTMALGFTLIGLGFASTGLAGSNLPLHFVAMTIFTIGEMCSMSLSNANVASLAPTAMRGRYMGALMMSWTSAGVLGPIGGALLYQSAPAVFWAACAVIGCTGATVIWRSGRLPAEAEGAVAEAVG